MTNVKMLSYSRDEFMKRGFVESPRGDKYLYNPELKISVFIHGAFKSSVSISVFDMVDDGMSWGTGYLKIPSGCGLRYKFNQKSFEDFYRVTFQNRVNKLNKLKEII